MCLTWKSRGYYSFSKRVWKTQAVIKRDLEAIDQIGKAVVVPVDKRAGRQLLMGPFGGNGATFHVEQGSRPRAHIGNGEDLHG